MKCSWKRFWVSLGGALFFTAMGLGVRYAEDMQVGYTHDSSLWVFGIGVLFAYYAALVLFLLWRGARRPAPKSPTTPT